MRKHKARRRKSRHSQNWTLFYANARGITSKKTSIIEIFGEVKPQLGFFTETMLKCSNGFNIDGYTFCGRSRDKKSCGGVGILVSNEIQNVVTPHETLRDIELTWVSIRRRGLKPIFMGVYYGKQETRNTRNEMLIEMDKLSEEIHEKKNEGEVILLMDGNGKIGLLDEEISRNGSLLLDVFNECELNIMNKSEKCQGKITRVNRRYPEQKSAIDFLVVTEDVEQQIQSVTIDEEGDYLLKGSSASDHNSFLVNLNLKEVDTRQREKLVRWRLNAPVEKWVEFRDELSNKSQTCLDVMEASNKNIEYTYQKWKQTIEGCAHETIGKTTTKKGSGPPESFVVRSIRAEKKRAKKVFENEVNYEEKNALKMVYIKKQQELRSQIEYEHMAKIEEKFASMSRQGKNGFWSEVKRVKKDYSSEWTSIKDEDGKRVLDPDRQKEIMAKYYSNLYSFDESLEKHWYHDYVKKKYQEFENNRDYEEQWYNEVPSKETIGEIVQAKKNKKATTDFPNEILKRGGDELIDCLYPVITNFWQNEIAPKEWNLGLISSIYKGKGDREKLQFHRGITVSSAVSMILEEAICQRMVKLIPFTQAQGGGKKGTSTRDHVFLLRGAMTYAMKNKWQMFITYYDVTKAYDRADIEDMLVTTWEHGLKGKLWRLMKALNTNLTAKIKTRHGLTEEISRIAGGKQGGKNFGFLFAKMMDVMAEEMEKDPIFGVKFEELVIALLEWVDDVATFAIGSEQQKQTMAHVNDFAVRHKLKWGKEKCKVMEVGNGGYVNKEWDLGKMKIDSCTDYKYLGDWIMRNGSNKKNLEEREGKVMAATRKIISLCGTEVIKNIQMRALLKLHETCTVPMLLSNCETWILKKGEREHLQKTELWALKKILNVPITTPTPAIWYITGYLLTPILIDKKQLLYLKTLLDRPERDWTKRMLLVLRNNGIGWAAQMDNLLEKYSLEGDWKKIAEMTVGSWKAAVVMSTEEVNKQTLLQMCQGREKEKTKTVFVAKKLKSVEYKRSPHEGILNSTKSRARVTIMGLFGMLKCANNYKSGQGGNECRTCEEVDDENHRINHCSRFGELNLYYSPIKFDFDCIFLDDMDSVSRAVEVVDHLWNLENGKNDMRCSAE